VHAKPAATQEVLLEVAVKETPDHRNIKMTFHQGCSRRHCEAAGKTVRRQTQQFRRYFLRQK